MYVYKFVDNNVRKQKGRYKEDDKKRRKQEAKGNTRKKDQKEQPYLL